MDKIPRLLANIFTSETSFKSKDDTRTRITHVYGSVFTRYFRPNDVIFSPENRADLIDKVIAEYDLILDTRARSVAAEVAERERLAKKAEKEVAAGKGGRLTKRKRHSKKQKKQKRKTRKNKRFRR